MINPEVYGGADPVADHAKLMQAKDEPLGNGARLAAEYGTSGLLRIVPPARDSGVAHLCQGTQVFTADGGKVNGVYGITLTACVDNIWRATIQCNVRVPELYVHGVVTEAKPLAWWRKLLMRIAGVKHYNVSTLDSTEMEYE